MANPIIDSITIEPNPIPTGQEALVTILAHDPDALTLTVNATVTDSSGNTTEVSATATTSDPLTYTATTDVGTLTQDDSQPNVFHLHI